LLAMDHYLHFAVEVVREHGREDIHLVAGLGTGLGVLNKSSIVL
jgi:hypothetical protein